MKKNFKIYMFLLILLFSFFTNANVSGINMNLQPYDSMTGNVLNEDNNSISDEVTNFNTNDVEQSNEDVSKTVETPRITYSTSEEDNFLTIENILSIVIIVIGILLILLAIAILIRLK